MTLQALRTIARALSNPVTPQQVADIVVHTVRQRFAPAAAVFYVLDPNGEAVLLASEGVPEASLSRFSRLPRSADLPLMTAIQRAETIWCETRAEILARYPRVANSAVAAEQLQSMIAIPFTIDERVLGGLALSFHVERALDASQREVLSTIGDLVAHAMDRHRLEERFRKMHEATPDGVGISRVLRDASGAIRDFQYLYVNPTVATAMGRTADDLIGRTLLECLPGIDNTPFWAAFCRVADTGRPETYEQPYTENGWAGWYRNMVVSLGEEIAITYSDITAQKKAEESLVFLAEASAILSSSLDYDTTLASVAMLSVPRIADWATVDMLDERGQLRRLAVAHVDPAKVSLGYELTKRYPIDMSAPSGVPNVIRTGQPEMLAKITDEMLQAGIPDQELLTIVRDIGLRSTICVPLKARSRVVGAISLFVAESERWYGEEDLRLAEELARRASMAVENALHYRAAEEASRAKDEFLAMVSHELRTPLTSILGWTHLLREKTLTPERQRKALETIDRNARSQSQLIDDLLDVSRMVSDTLRLDMQSVDLALVIERAVDTVRPTALAKGIAIETTHDPAASWLVGDPMRLQQIVWNLLSNAVKFSESGAQVHLRVQHLDDSIEIVVRDQGSGIEPDFLPHVFERFRQADASTTRARGGLGLGLAIVRRLVELHGGIVRAESEGRNRGATFVVKLPTTPRRTATIRRPPALQHGAHGGGANAHPALSGARILVLDDEADARELVAELLTQCDAVVSTAGRVQEALRIVAEERPLVVISDIGMPDEDGYAFIRQLRSLPPSKGGNTPAVALTAYSRTEDRTKALVAGFNMHVPKPVEPAELLAVLASLMATRRD